MSDTSQKQKYISMLHKVYIGGTNNHPEHNTNPDYWNILLGDVKHNPRVWEDKNALDFGCGKGRNITNLFSLSVFHRIDGVDISSVNIEACKNYLAHLPVTLYNNNGNDLSQLLDNEYDLVISTIVFQHLCVHELRMDLKKEIFRILKPNGIFSFQMAFGPSPEEFPETAVPGRQLTSYHANNYDAQDSNGASDVRVTDPQQLVSDLQSIGFTNITYTVRPSWEDSGHPEWIYVRCQK